MAGGVSTITAGSALGSSLRALLLADDIEPGSTPSYQICKVIYAYHPLGLKMAESPIKMAQSQERELSIPKGPEDDCKEAFVAAWKKINADKHIFNVMRLSRVYGIASLAMVVDGQAPDAPIEMDKIWQQVIRFNVLDPLNTAGSLVLSQDPNSLDFQRSTNIVVNGTMYHRSKTVVMMNEDPLYIEYTPSAFGYVGRSVYQRSLFPLKSFIETMITDDMVSQKAGVLIAKLKQPGSIIDNLMAAMAGMKRQLVKEAKTNNVISISAGDDEDVTSLNLQNVNEAMNASRKNILENIAVSADMPAKLLNSETFAEGFGEGTEDAKAVAGYIDGVRVQMAPLYDFFDPIVMRLAWTPDWYKTIQAKYPKDFGSIPYEQAFYEFANSFATQWPSLLKEPDSEQIKVDDVKLKAVIALLDSLMPNLDPANKAAIIDWACDNFNELKLMFGSPLYLDTQAMIEYAAEQQAKEEEQAERELEAQDNGEGSEPGDKTRTKPPPPASTRGDAHHVTRPSLLALDKAVAKLTPRRVTAGGNP